MRTDFCYWWGFAMSFVVFWTYTMILLRGGVAEISVVQHHELIWEYPLISMGCVWYLLQVRKKAPYLP